MILDFFIKFHDNIYYINLQYNGRIWKIYIKKNNIEWCYYIDFFFVTTVLNILTYITYVMPIFKKRSC